MPSHKAVALFLHNCTMNKKAILALLLAMLMPFTGYYLVKYFSKGAVEMPGRYFYDSVIVTEKSGRTTTDTIWHKVKNMTFTNQLGKQVTLDDLKGKIIVVDFFFTRCPTICPGLTRNMKKLQESFAKNDSIVQFLSVTVDPVHDSVPQLRKFANSFNANHDTWWFVTAGKNELKEFALKEMKANVADTEVDTAFVHTENFFLLDKNRVIRGWYNAFDTVKQAQLARTIPLLLLERNKNEPSFFRNFIPILPVIFVGIGIVIIGVALLSRNKKRGEAINKAQ
jgi:protein SCO1